MTILFHVIQTSLRDIKRQSLVTILITDLLTIEVVHQCAGGHEFNSSWTNIQGK